MSHWPTQTVAPGPKRFITPYGNFSASAMSGRGGFAFSSAAVSSANRAVFLPIRIAQPTLVKKLFWMNGGGVAGNADIGVYTLDGVRLSSAGTTAQSGTNAIQEVNVTDFVLGQGIYYLAFVASTTTTARYLQGRISNNVPQGKALGELQQAAALPLPTTATFATTSGNVFPVAGLEIDI